MKKILVTSIIASRSIIVMIVFGFILCFICTVVAVAFLTKYSINGGSRLPTVLRTSILGAAQLPYYLKGVVELVQTFNKPNGEENIYKNLVVDPSAKYNGDGHLLFSIIGDNGLNKVIWFNLTELTEYCIFESPEELRPAKYADELAGSESRRYTQFSSRNRVWNPYISANGKLIYSLPWNDIVAIDLNSNKEIWRVKGAFHHSIEPGENGDIWTCASADPGTFSQSEKPLVYPNKVFEDNILVKINEDGQIIDRLSVADLLIKNGLEYMIYGFASLNTNLDPFHLNQIAPIKEDIGIFKKGLLLVSLRNLSTVVLVDPIQRKVLWYKSGPWMNQHSVSQIGESKISILDNHSFATGSYWLNYDWETRVVIYDIPKDRLSYQSFNLQSLKYLRIPVEGKVSRLDQDQWLIEDSLYGTILVFNQGRLAVKWQNNYTNGNVGTSSWCRYYKSNDVSDWIKDRIIKKSEPKF